MNDAERFARDAPARPIPTVRAEGCRTLILLDRTGAAPKVLMGRPPPRPRVPAGPIRVPRRPRRSRRPRMPVARPTRSARRGKADAPAFAAAERCAGARARARRDPRDLRGDRADARRTRAEPPGAPSGAWSAFAEANVHPDLAGIHFIARAITPPGRARRYDTRFFAADAARSRIGSTARPVPMPNWSNWCGCRSTRPSSLELLAITELVLEALQAQIAAGFSHDRPGAVLSHAARQRFREML